MAADVREYQKKYRATHKSHIAQLKRDWYQRNREEISRKRKIKMEHCYWCERVWDEPRNVLRYKSKLFCNEQCLAKYLIDKADDDIEDYWVDTEENKRLCAEEDKYDEFI